MYIRFDFPLHVVVLIVEYMHYSYIQCYTHRNQPGLCSMQVNKRFIVFQELSFDFKL